MHCQLNTIQSFPIFSEAEKNEVDSIEFDLHMLRVKSVVPVCSWSSSSDPSVWLRHSVIAEVVERKEDHSTIKRLSVSKTISGRLFSVQRHEEQFVSCK